jgi:hypothetical protein
MNLHAPHVPSRPPDTIPALGTHDHFTINMLVEGLLEFQSQVSLIIPRIICHTLVLVLAI